MNFKIDKRRLNFVIKKNALYIKLNIKLNKIRYNNIYKCYRIF